MLGRHDQRLAKFNIKSNHFIINVAGDNRWAQELTIDHPMKIMPDTIVATDKYAGKGAVIEGCTFSNGLANGIRVQSPGITIKDNVIRHVKSRAVKIQSYPVYWGEGSIIYDVVVKNNIIDSTGFGNDYTPGNIGPDPAMNVITPGVIGKAQPIDNVSITGNTFIQTKSWPAIKAIDIDGLNISDNKFTVPLVRLSYLSSKLNLDNPVKVTHSPSAIVKNNILIGSD